MSATVASDLIEGKTYIVTNWSSDQPRKKMEARIKKSEIGYITAETKVVLNNGYRGQTHIGLSCWPASLIDQWTFVEVSA